MNQKNLIAKISQIILDANHPGKQSNQVINELCPGLLNNSCSVIELFAHWLNDCMGQTNLGTRESNPKALVRLNSMLNELCLRFLLIPHNQTLVNRFADHMHHAIQWKRAYENLQRKSSSLSQTSGAAFIVNQINVAIEKSRHFDYPVYIIGRAEITLKGAIGHEVREQFHPPTERNATKFNFPLSENAKIKLANEKAYLKNVTTNDLAKRIIHELRSHNLAKCDIEYPVYGVNSIYALIPWMISQCQESTSELERPLENKQALEAMKAQTDEMNHLIKRADRISSNEITPIAI